VYISANVRYTNKCVKAGLAEAYRWSGNGRVKQFTKHRISFIVRDHRRRHMCADDTTRYSISGSPSHGASACNPHMATERLRNPPSNRVKWAPESHVHLLSAEDGTRRTGDDGSRANRLDLLGTSYLRGLTRAQRRSRLAHQLTEKSKFVGICGGGSDLTLGEGNCGCSMYRVHDANLIFGAFPPLALLYCHATQEGSTGARRGNCRIVCEK
jgi:hypothetical protein